jgi:hypothetical protein
VRRVVIVIVVLVSASCASRAAAPSGGIEGRVTIGPTCPVEQVGSDGSYRLALTPGTYTVTPVVQSGGPPTARPAMVTVGTTMQQLDLQLDSGIR